MKVREGAQSISSGSTRFYFQQRQLSITCLTASREESGLQRVRRPRSLGPAMHNRKAALQRLARRTKHIHVLVPLERLERRDHRPRERRRRKVRRRALQSRREDEPQVGHRVARHRKRLWQKLLLERARSHVGRELGEAFQKDGTLVVVALGVACEEDGEDV